MREVVLLLAQYTHWGLNDLRNLTQQELLLWLESLASLLTKQSEIE